MTSSTAWKRANPEKNRAHARKSFRSFSGKISHVYSLMRTRVAGKGSKNAHLYKGLALLPRDEFLEWSSAQPAYINLWINWVISGFNMKLTPSVDRKDSSKGYVIENIEWVTHSENSRRAANQRHHGVAA